MSSSTISDGFKRHIAKLCKNHRVLRTIDDLFTYAGAKMAWKENFQKHYSPDETSQRMNRTFLWFGAIDFYTDDDELKKEICQNLVELISLDSEIPEEETKKLEILLEQQNLGEFKDDREQKDVEVPDDPQKVLRIIFNGFHLATLPLKRRRENANTFDFEDEYDVQDLMTSLLKPWFSDIRRETYTPNYAGSSARTDIYLPDQKTILELKRVRSENHKQNLADELKIDIPHYRKDHNAEFALFFIYDPSHYFKNRKAIKDLEGIHDQEGKKIEVEIYFSP